jgi:hypothetical protein
MASADFSKRIPWPCGIGSLIARHVWRSPRVRRNPFPRLPPDLPMSHPSGYRASLSMARLPCEHRPCIRFLFVGSEFCLRLPPDPASRQRPCLQLTVPTTTACSGLAPYRITSCLAHHHKKGRPVRAAFSIICFLWVRSNRVVVRSAGCVQQQADQPGSWVYFSPFNPQCLRCVCVSSLQRQGRHRSLYLEAFVHTGDEAWQQIQC